MELDESALQSLIEDYGNVVYSVSYDGGSPGHTGSARVLHCLESYWSCDDNGNFGGPYNDIDEALFDCHIRFGEVDLDVSSSELSSQQIASRLELDCPTGHIVSINEEEWVMDKDGELNLCAEDEDESTYEDYTKAIELDPKDATNYSARGNAYGELEKYPEAIADYTKAIELDPKDATNYSARGNAYVELKKYEEAIVDYTKAIELDPKDATNYYARGYAYDELE